VDGEATVDGAGSAIGGELFDGNAVLTQAERNATASTSSNEVRFFVLFCERVLVDPTIASN
jgi:hypothetical protein